MSDTRNFTQFQIHLPETLVQSISSIAQTSDPSVETSNRAPNPNSPPNTSQPQPDFSDTRKWIKFTSSDESVVLYFDPVTKQIWGEGSGDADDSGMSVEEDNLDDETMGESSPAQFSDEEINAAARIAGLLGSPKPRWERQRNPTPQFPSQVESDTDPAPRFTSAEKGKQKESIRNTILDNVIPGGAGAHGGGTSTTRYAATEDRPATFSDLAQLADSIRIGQHEMAQMIIDGLGPHIGRSGRATQSGRRDTGNDGDVDEDFPPTPRGRAPKRRDSLENELSINIRKYMHTLIGDHNWLKNMVTEQEANAFDPELGPCCGLWDFRLHLGGTTCNAWNKSAISVFVDGFIAAHSKYSSSDESVRDMVQLKSRASLDSIIRKYRESNVLRTSTEQNELRLQKSRQERKRKLFYRRRRVAAVYPRLKQQIPLLDQLSTAGMSSDEEVVVGKHKQYDVIVPAWRSQCVTAWLRIFDSMYGLARESGLLGPQGGAEPRLRIVGEKKSTSGKFVPRLPENAYDKEWLTSQLNYNITIRPGPRARYFHDRTILDLACR